MRMQNPVQHKLHHFKKTRVKMLADFEDLILLRAGIGDGKKVMMIKQNYTHKHTK